MKLRTILAAAGAAAILALGVTVPAHAATTRPAVYVQSYYTQWNPDQSYGWALSATNQIYNGHILCDSCGGIEYDYEIINGSGGYNEFAQVQLNAVLLWELTGYCIGWNQSLFRIVKQTCNGASYQLWAGTGTHPDLIWNQWYDTNYHTACPISGGYTQSVITSDTGLGAVYLSCPRGAGGQSYTGSQYWWVTAS